MAKRERTTKQNKTLNWLLTEAGLDPRGDDARDYLESVCGKRYRRDMDFYDHQAAIRDLGEKTGKLPDAGRAKSHTRPAAAAARPGGGKDDPATSEQLVYIREMLENMGADHRKRGEWIKRQTGSPFPLTRGDAQGLIEALKKMRARDYRFDAPPAAQGAYEGTDDV